MELLRSLDQRFSAKFFSAKQRYKALLEDDVATHFKSLAGMACTSAVKDAILSHHAE